MTKRIIFFTITIIILFLISFSLNDYILHKNDYQVSFSLLSVYLFHAISAFFIYFLIELIAENVPDQSGYGYLALISIKLGVFVLVFKSDVFANEHLSQFERFSLVIPLFLFLIAEAVSIAKLLNSK